MVSMSLMVSPLRAIDISIAHRCSVSTRSMAAMTRDPSLMCRSSAMMSSPPMVVSKPAPSTSLSPSRRITDSVSVQQDLYTVLPVRSLFIASSNLI